MSDSSDQLTKIIKYVGIAAVSVGINHILRSFINKETPPLMVKSKSFKEIPSIAMVDEFTGFVNDEDENYEAWSTIELPAPGEGEDGLMQELEIMTRIVCPFQRVNNLIVDLEIKNPKTYPCPLVAHKVKRHKDEPFLLPESLIEPG